MINTFKLREMVHVDQQFEHQTQGKLGTDQTHVYGTH